MPPGGPPPQLAPVPLQHGHPQRPHAPPHMQQPPPHWQQHQQPPPLREPAGPLKTGYGPDGFMPKEEAVAAFKALLAEKGVHAFSRYERELPKLQPDKRFKYVPTIAERKQAFEAYCKESVSKKAVKKAGAGTIAGSKIAGAAAATASSPAAEFERLLNEIEQACNSAMGARGDGGPPAWGPDLALEQLEAHWGSDPRWQRCTSEQRQAALDKQLAALRQAARKEQETAYRALLREHGVAASTRWSKTKDVLSADPRYLALPRDDREDLFRQYTAELSKAEESMRERENKQREAERRLEAERRTAEQRQKSAAHVDALTHYRALLQELHLGPDARWRDYAERIMKDAQGRGSNPALERGEAESVFRDHVAEMVEDLLEAFLDLLDQEIKPLIPSREQQQSSGLPKPLLRYRDAEPLLEDDPRFARLPEEYRERTWRRYIEDELYNRDFPLARQHTQRKQRRGTAAGGAGGGPGGGPGGGNEEGVVGTRRARPPSLDDGGLDRAYLREYIDVDAKRMRRD